MTGVHAAAEGPASSVLHTRWLGRVPYREAWDLQRALFASRVRGEAEDHLLLLEHPHTYTLGRRSDPGHLLLDEDGYESVGAEVVAIDRGGDVTYHGPGQLVAYPILRLGRPDVVAHVRRLEELAIRTLADFGVAGFRAAGFSGVWVDRADPTKPVSDVEEAVAGPPVGAAKICAVGCRVTRGVTMHGLALNVDPDMAYWRHIVACGIDDLDVASLAQLVQDVPAVRDLAQVMAEHAPVVFGRQDGTFAGDSRPSTGTGGRRIPLEVRSLRAGAVEAGPDVREQARERPPWLKRRAALADPGYMELRSLVRRLDLHTVCEEAGCPNIYECWSERTATLMILGRDCTRSCGYCEVGTARPLPVDPDEPERVADAVDALDLAYAVLTSVARDDLPDGGAATFAACIHAIRERRPECEVEVLVPDFRGDEDSARMVFAAQPDVFNHNLETVARLQRLARPQAGYARSLALLGRAASAGLVTKSGVIVGLGEANGEVVEAMADLRAVGVQILTLGQYLRPSGHHLPVDRWVDPDEFAELAETARLMGFAHVESGPLVRSSYHARAGGSRRGDRGC